MQTDIVSSTNSEDRASSNRKWELRDLVVLSSATESAPEAKASVSPASDANDARSLAQTAVRSVPRPILDVLKLRGIEAPEQIANWFKPTLRSLRDPLSLKDMDKAVERLLLAREESIVLYGDYDLDGTSGLALALQALREFGFTRVHGYQPQRLTEGYGLHNEAIERLKRETDCTLLISIDLGITAMEEVETARALGIDVIVTDHHLPKRDADAVILPNACAVVNPNRGDCPSQMGHLCGTGVIFYLVLALRRALLEQGMLGGAESVLDPKELLDCFAIGTITDLVPLQFENRILVKHGLVKLAETKRPGLQELLKALDLWGRPLTAQDVAIKFAPKLNALSRMGSGIQPLDLYLEADVEKARELVSRVLSNNQDRQASQKMADEEADRLLAERPPQGAIVIASEKFHRGVVGLVATKQSQRHGLPAFVASIEGEAGSVVGSARVPQGMSLSLLDALTSASNYLDQFGGHAVAAGFEARLATFEDFRRTLERWFLEHAGESGADGTLTTLKYDASCSLADLNAGFMAWHDHMGPFGAHAPVPVFRFDHCLVSQVRVLKGGHLRLKLVQSGAQAVQAIWFSPPEGAEPRQGEYVSVLAEVQWNHFQGMRTIQLLVTDLLAEPRA